MGYPRSNLVTAEYDATGTQTFNPGSIASPGVFTPGVLQDVLAIASERSAIIFFSLAPFATSYEVIDNSTGRTVATGFSSPITVPDLTNGVAKTFTLVAVNANGESGIVTNTVTPRALPTAMAGVKGIIAWWDASQITPQTDNTVIATVPDFSGNGFSLTNTVAAQQARYRSTIFNGRPALEFNWNGDDLTNISCNLTAAQLGGDYTVITAFMLKSLTNASGARDQRIWTTENRRYDGSLFLGTSDNNLGGGGTSLIALKGGSGDFFNTGTTFGAMTITTPYIATVVGGKQLFMNGNRQPISGGGIPSMLNRPQGFTLGGIPNFADDQSFNGYTATCLIAKTSLLGDVGRFKAEAYIATLNGMTAPVQQATI